MSAEQQQQPFNEVYVEGLLEETKEHLKNGPPTMKIKTAIKHLLELIAVDEQKPKKIEKKKSKKAVPKGVGMNKITAECCICHLEKEGTFYLRGFKCQECRGFASDDSVSSSMIKKANRNRFNFRDVEQEFAERVRVKATTNAKADADNEKSRSEKDNNNNKSDQEGGTPIARSNSVRRTGLSLAKYSVLTIDLPQTTTTATAVDEVRQRLSQFRHLYHPCLVYTHACGYDQKRNQCYFVQENVHCVLDSQRSLGYKLSLSSSPSESFREQNSNAQITSTTASTANASESSTSAYLNASEVEYERSKKLVVAALHGIGFMHFRHIIHGDLRPHNIMCDAERNIKIRVGMLKGSSSLLPHPFRPPECSGESSNNTSTNTDAENDVLSCTSPVSPLSPLSPLTSEQTFRSQAAMDMFVLGQALKYIIFGPTLQLRNEEEDEEPSPERTTLYQLLSSMTDPDPINRATAEQALKSGQLATVRVVNGFPVETVVAFLIDESQAKGLPDTTTTATTTATTTMYEEEKEYGEKQRSIRVQHSLPSSDSLVDNGGEEEEYSGSMTAMMDPIEVAPYFKLLNRNSEGAEVLHKFFSEDGPAFQIISHQSHITLYSLKRDPRRKASELRKRSNTVH